MIENVFLALALQVDVNGYATCNQTEADKGIQVEMNICAAEEFKNADKLLNVQWKLTAAAMKERDAAGDFPETREQSGFFGTMREAQKAWLIYRDAQCRSEGYRALGGSLEPLFVSSCLTRMTLARTEELADLAQEY